MRLLQLPGLAQQQLRASLTAEGWLVRLVLQTRGLALQEAPAILAPRPSPIRSPSIRIRWATRTSISPSSLLLGLAGRTWIPTSPPQDRQTSIRPTSGSSIRQPFSPWLMSAMWDATRRAQSSRIKSASFPASTRLRQHTLVAQSPVDAEPTWGTQLAAP